MKSRLYHNALFVWVLVLSPSASVRASQLQITGSSGYLRSTVESYPGPERRSMLDDLDQSRVVSDRAVQDLIMGRGEELVRQIEATIKALGDPADVPGGIEHIIAMYGAVTAAEYRNQALEFPADKLPDVRNATAANFYGVRTTKRSDEGLYLTIKTVRLNGEHRIFFMQLVDYSGKAPPWLLPPKKP